MEPIQIVLLLILAVSLILNGIVLFVVLQRGKPKDDSQSAFLIQNQLEALTRTLDARMGETSKNMNEAMRQQFGDSQRLVREINEQVRLSLLDVTREQTKTNEATQQFVSIAAQLSNLEKVLKHQKQRGNLGEASLALILDNILPPTAYKIQHQFSDGETVDAVIITKDGFIPVDAKFSLDNYTRLINETDDVRREELEKEFKSDLKKRIDETAKYIKPKEGTLPFAFMFIPAEAIYYDLLVNEVGAVKVNTRSLIDYAYKDKGVIIVSPTTFAAYLQSVLYGFRAFKIEEQAIGIAKNVEQLGRHLNAYSDYFRKLGTALGTTVSHFNSASKELGKVDKDVMRITGTTAELEVLALEKPVKDEE